MIHIGEKPYACNICGRKFRAYCNLLKQNRLIHATGEKLYPCNSCNISNVDGHNVEASQDNGKATESKAMMHAGEKSYACETCGRQFRSYRNLLVHNRIHARGKRLFTCKDCGRGFISQAALKSHVHSCQAIVKHCRCKHCGMTFSRIQTRNVHLQTCVKGLLAAGDMPYTCEECDKKFTEKFALDVHMRKHLGEKPYPCDKCEMTFLSSSGSNDHVKACHDDAILVKSEISEQL